jgi:ribosome-binding factor A
MKIDRKLRLGELIKRELANIIIHEIKTPLLSQATIVGAKIAPDLSIAKIFVSTFDKSKADETIKELQEQSKTLRHYLAKNLNLRITPKLIFVYDDSIIRGQELDTIIDKAIAKDEAMHEETEK